MATFAAQTKSRLTSTDKRFLEIGGGFRLLIGGGHNLVIQPEIGAVTWATQTKN